MREGRRVILLCAVLACMFSAGCGKEAGAGRTDPGGNGADSVTQTEPEENGAKASQGQKIAVETDESIYGAAEGKSYYMEMEERSAPVPCLTLYDDGSFVFSYDVQSSYLAAGSYELKDGKLKAVTGDGRYHYVWKAEGGRYLFVRDESSEVSVIDAGIGIPIDDGAVFALEEKAEGGQAHMTAVVKEIRDGSLLVSSRTEEFPGVYCVCTGDLDVRGIEGGDEVLIVWNGTVLETDPAQIYADALEKK